MSEESHKLECGHPSGARFMMDGKCGTCAQADDFEELAKTDDAELRRCCLQMAQLFRDGVILYDVSGNSLIELCRSSAPTREPL